MLDILRVVPDPNNCSVNFTWSIFKWGASSRGSSTRCCAMRKSGQMTNPGRRNPLYSFDLLIILFSDTIIQPITMMIKDFNAFIACSTVFRLLLDIYFANITITVSKKGRYLSCIIIPAWYEFVWLGIHTWKFGTRRGWSRMKLGILVSMCVCLHMTWDYA